MGWKEISFASTIFKSEEEFEKFLKKNNLTNYKEIKGNNSIKENKQFLWFNDDKTLIIRTYNNPITEEYDHTKLTSLEGGERFAGYIVIKGEEEKVDKLAKFVKKHTTHFVKI